MQHPVPDPSIRHFVFTEDPVLPKDDGGERKKRRPFQWMKRRRQPDGEMGEQPNWFKRFWQK